MNPPDVARFAPLLALAALLALAPLAPALAAPAEGPLQEDRSRVGDGDLDDPPIPSLDAAVLKTGFRAVVTWTTDELARGELAWSLPDQPTYRVAEPTPRRHHAFVLRDLPAGETLTFTASHTTHEGVLPMDTVESETHQVPLVNADRHNPDPPAGYYTINLTLAANENPVDRDTLEAGLDRFARLVWDATDGHVAVDDVVLLYDDPRHGEAGLACGYSPAQPACTHAVDATFSYGNLPHASGTTFLGAIEDPTKAIYMNNLYESAAQPAVEEVAQVLAHEFGHYAFFMDEAYSVGTEITDCWDPDTGVSIMGLSPQATEFDGPTAPCPDGQPGERSWTSLADHYAAVGPRTGGPDPGPATTGPEYDLRVLDFSAGSSLPDPDPGGHEPVVASGTDPAHCRSGVCAAVSATGPASGLLAASATGPADGTAAASGADRADGDAAGASGVGDAFGFAALSGNGTAQGTLAASGVGPSQGQVAASAAGDARGETAAASGTGTAEAPVAASGSNDCGANPCVAVAPEGSAEGETVALALDGPASALVAASLLDDAEGVVAASGNGTAAGSAVAASTTGPAQGFAAASGTGDASGVVSVSLTGEADGTFLSVSGCQQAKDLESDLLCHDADPVPALP